MYFVSKTSHFPELIEEIKVLQFRVLQKKEKKFPMNVTNLKKSNYIQ